MVYSRARNVAAIATALFVGCTDDRGSAEGDASFSGSASEEGNSAEGTGSATSGSADGAATGADSADSADSAPGDSGQDGSDGGPIFDVGVDTDGATGGQGECGCGNSDWSYIWIANSSEHTVSKINTRTLVEEGRYRTRPDGSGNPSRTSVSIDGKAMAIANRFSGLTKIWALSDFCEDKNGNGQIDTSNGPGNVLAFDAEECIAWHTAIPAKTVQRPVAWTSGTLDEASCEYVDQKVWTATGEDGPSAGQCGPTGLWVHRLDGETGAVEDTVFIPQNEVPCTFGASDWGFGFYGGAVDPDNNAWFSTFGGGKVVKVDYETLDYTVFNGSSYGITVDTEGRPWVGDSPQRMDPMTGVWMGSGAPGAGGSGIAQDLMGRMWSATQNGVVWVDMETLAIGDTVVLPQAGLYRGISVDIDGYIWAVLLGGTVAYKIDPVTYEFDMVGGLNGPYTYSDMSGGQLANVTCHRPEG
jgi:hypothetical protein